MADGEEHLIEHSNAKTEATWPPGPRAKRGAVTETIELEKKKKERKVRRCLGSPFSGSRLLVRTIPASHLRVRQKPGIPVWHGLRFFILQFIAIKGTLLCPCACVRCAAN